MKTCEIISEWKKDTTIDKTDLDSESLKIPNLHGKYWGIYLNEKNVLQKFQMELKRMSKLKKEYYQGLLSQEELETFGWTQFSLKVIKQDLQTYIDADTDIIKRNLRMSEQSEKVEFLRDILKSLHNRSFQIKNAIDFIRFTAGLN